jgi:hypothetical protein
VTPAKHERAKSDVAVTRYTATVLLSIQGGSEFVNDRKIVEANVSSRCYAGDARRIPEIVRSDCETGIYMKNLLEEVMGETTSPFETLVA